MTCLTNDIDGDLLGDGTDAVDSSDSHGVGARIAVGVCDGRVPRQHILVPILLK